MSSVFARRWRSLAYAFSAAGMLSAGLATGAAAGDLADLARTKVDAPAGKEAPQLATARSRTWISDDGSHTTRVYARQVNVREGGQWLAIDNTLRPDGKGGFEAVRGAEDLTLPSSLDRPVRVVDGDAWLELSLRGSKAVAKLDGATAIYEGAGDGVTAKLTANNAAVKEDLVLASAEAQNAFTYDLRLSNGLRPVGRADGGIDVLDGEGDLVFAAPAPVAADAKGVPAPAESMSQTVKADGDGWVVSLSIDRRWLTEPGRAFPAVLDPSFSIPSPGRDCSLRSVDPTSVECGSTLLYAGRLSASNLNTGLAYFNLAGQVPQAAFISDAKLKLTPTLVTSAGAAKSLVARDVTTDWDNNATWNSRTASAAWTTPGGDLGTAIESSIPHPASASVVSKFTVTNLVTRWVASPATNRGVGVNDNGSAINGAVAYASSESSDSSKWPALEVTYWPRTGQTGNYTIDSQQLTDRQSLGVNVASGNLMLTSKELQVANTGVPLDVTRYYNSGEEWDGQAGQGGRFSIGKDIVLYECDDAGSRCLVGPSGFRVRFTKNATTGAFATPDNIGNWSLTKLTTGSMNFELKDNGSGTVMEFFDAPYSWLKAIRDKNGVSRETFENLGTGSSLSKITDAHGRDYPVTTSSGRVTQIEVPTALVGGSTSWKWKYTYNPFGFLTSAEDPNGKITAYDYNAANKLSKITDPRGNDTLITYDTAGRVTSVTRKVDGTTTNDVTTEYQYVAVDSACSATTGGTVVAPNVVGKTIVKDPNGWSTTYCYDQNGAVVVAKDPENRVRSTTYTPEGNVSELSSLSGTFSPYATTAYTYGSGSGTASNPTKITSPAGERTDISYGSVPGAPTTGELFKWAQPKSTTDTEGDTTSLTYEDETNRLNVKTIENSRGGGATTLSAELGWDSTNKSRLASSKVNGNTTLYGYTNGNLTTVTPPNATIMGVATYTYDGISRVARSKDGRAAPWVDYTYDKVGRQLTTPDSDGQTQSLTYDNNGNVTARSVVAAGQSSGYAYDKLGRRTSETLAGATTTYSYDKAGNLKTLTDASGTVTYTYDKANRLTQVQSPTVSGGTDTTTYDNNDPTASGGTGSIVANLPGGGKIIQTFDTSGKLRSVQAKDSGGVQTLLQSNEYVGDRADDTPTTADNLGNLQSSLTQFGGTTATPLGRYYAYRTGSQLLGAISTAGGSVTETATYSYDPSGNRLSRTRTPASGPAAITSYAYNANNQLCWQRTAGVAFSPDCGTVPTSATTYTYDMAGNQTSTGSGPGVAMSWDAKGRLKTLGTENVTLLSPNNNELNSVGVDSYTNTALGVSRITSSGGTLTKLTRDPSGSAVSQIRGSSKLWFITDQIGSTIGLVNSAGTLATNIVYDPDGNNSTAGADTPIKFAGGHEVGYGLYHYGARYYQPTTARWTQPDPLLQPGDLGQANRYAYVANNPINAADPSGLVSCKLLGLFPPAGLGCASTKAVNRLPGTECRSVYYTTGGVIGARSAGAAGVGVGIFLGNEGAERLCKK